MPDAWFRVDATTRTRGGIEETLPVFMTLVDTTPVQNYSSNEDGGVYVAHVEALSGILNAIRNLQSSTELTESEAISELRAMDSVADDVTADSFSRRQR